MLFSVNWLSELAGGIEIPPRDLALLVTTRTAEQEGVEPVGAHFGRVRAARVTAVEPIEGSHNVKAAIDAGDGVLRTVVCGAPNCRPGIVTAWVPPGTVLGDKTIGRATIAGVQSDGMLASGAELGINRDQDGVLELSSAPGSAIPGCAPDWAIEIDNKSLTHRPDLWGHLGMAREVAAIAGGALSDPVDMALLPAAENAAVTVAIEDLALCPRYSALVFDNVTVGPSPLWLQYRLESIGLNSINNIVDVTNYLAAELAQPTHAFDGDKLIGGAIFVRLARDGERIVALNNEEYALDGNALVIADAAGPVAVAGVIGGLDSSVTDSTTRVVFESANFHPGHIRKTSARLKCRTDASMRFEKAQDPENTTRALARAIALLREVSPGIRLLGGLADVRAPRRVPPPIELDIDWLGRKLGRAVTPAEVRAILESLSFIVGEPKPGLLLVGVPSWRATKDISLREDLVEEVGRIIGYDNITPAPPLLPAAPPPGNPVRDYLHGVRLATAAQGFTEVYNYSFVSEEHAAEIGLDPASHVRVANPIASDQGLLRRSLIAGLLKNIRENARHLPAFRLFEIGRAIVPEARDADALPKETPWLGAVVYAREGDGAAGLQEAKRLAECLLPGATVGPAEARPHEHPVRAWDVRWRGVAVGRLGEFHPRLVEGRAAVLEINLQAAMDTGARPARYRPLDRYPSSSFDLSIVVPTRALVGELDTDLRRFAGDRLREVEYVRQYSGPPLAEDRKSVSFRITIGAPDRTLSAGEITAARNSLIEAMRAAGYELRV
ncbi:MAG: phenylalanine--tRNA ligase subunit beta [Bryobacteraceae bacterium]